MGLLALASVTSHKELAPMMHTCTQRDGSGDAHRGGSGRGVGGVVVVLVLHIYPLYCVAMLRCSVVLYVILLVCKSVYAKQWRQPAAVVDGAAGACQ